MQLSPEVTVGFPVEVFVQGRPGFVEQEMLGITAELETDLVAWLRWWQEQVGPGYDDDEGDDAIDEPDEEWSGWREHGGQLAQRLQEELGEDCDVDWA